MLERNFGLLYEVKYNLILIATISMNPGVSTRRQIFSNANGNRGGYSVGLAHNFPNSNFPIFPGDDNITTRKKKKDATRKVQQIEPKSAQKSVSVRSLNFNETNVAHSSNNQGSSPDDNLAAISNKQVTKVIW